HQDHPDSRSQRLHRLEGLETVDPRHTDIHQDNCVVVCANCVHRCFAAVGAIGFPAMQSNDVDQSPYHLLLVVNDEHAPLHLLLTSAVGSDTDIVVPAPGLLFAEISPPFASASPRETASPRPIPRALVVKSGSKSFFIWSAVIPA